MANHFLCHTDENRSSVSSFLDFRISHSRHTLDTRSFVACGKGTGDHRKHPFRHACCRATLGMALRRCTLLLNSSHSHRCRLSITRSPFWSNSLKDSSSNRCFSTFIRLLPASLHAKFIRTVISSCFVYYRIPSASFNQNFFNTTRPRNDPTDHANPTRVNNFFVSIF